MAFKLAEAFVELRLRDSDLIAGLARVNRAVDDTHDRLASLSRLTSSPSVDTAFPPQGLSEAAPSGGDARRRGTEQPSGRGFRSAEALVQLRGRETSSQAELNSFGRLFADLADPLRELSSSIGRLSPDGVSDDETISDPRSGRSFDSGGDNFSTSPALSNSLSPGATPRDTADRADRQRQRQLEALRRLDENVSRILQIQESRHAAGTAVFSPPA